MKLDSEGARATVVGREAGRIPGLPLTVLPHLGGTSGLKEMTTLTPQKPQDIGMLLYVFTNSLKLASGGQLQTAGCPCAR